MTQTSASGPESREAEESRDSGESEESEAVLVGSLGSFALPEVLTLASASGAHGRLAVTAPGVDGHLWMEDGELTGFLAGRATTLTEAVFDLALVTDGWFSFVPGGRAPAPGERRPVPDVLAEVEPQVAEWRELTRRLSLDALVHLSPKAPGAEVQIRADQWQALTTIGTTGSRVRDVLVTMGSQYVVALRLVCELLEAGLIEILEASAAQGDTPGAHTMAATVTSFPGATWVPPRSETAPATNGQPVPPSEVEVLPPPSSTDLWIPPPVGHEPVSSRNGETA